jgi:N-acetylglucosaminyl-diphospho-decaprenol L-rhamnosyltransferase
MSEPLVSVIVVSYGTRDLTLAALDSLQTTRSEIDLEVIVVDNASPDDSAEAVASRHPWTHLIVSEENRGFGAGANAGARAAHGTWLLFLNSDARLPSGALTRLLEIAGSLLEPGAIGPRLETPSGRPERSAGHFLSPWRDFVQAFRLNRLFGGRPPFEGVAIDAGRGGPRRVDWVSGACLLVLRELFQSVGAFDEAYFLYVEDMDLCFRFARAGRENYYVPEVIVHHELGQSRRRVSRPILIDGGRGPEYFVRKFGIWYPPPLQRMLRAINLLGWLCSLELRRFRSRIAHKDTAEITYFSRVCRESLIALFRSN